jgi:hypothetical protein
VIRGMCARRSLGVITSTLPEASLLRSERQVSGEPQEPREQRHSRTL